RRGLKPIFETRVRRTVYPIQSGDSEIELTVDKGKVEAGRQSSPLCELELELKRGKSAELFKLARMLAEEVPVQLAVKSKAERGYALIAGELPQAVKAAPVALTPDYSRQAAFQIIARTCLRQLVANQPATLGGDPEGLHQIRVALRRLRAAISLFADMLLDPQTEEMKAQFKWITQELGPARELDGVIKRVVRPVAHGKANGAGMAVFCQGPPAKTGGGVCPRLRGRRIHALSWSCSRHCLLDRSRRLDAQSRPSHPRAARTADCGCCRQRAQATLEEDFEGVYATPRARPRAA